MRAVVVWLGLGLAVACAACARPSLDNASASVNADAARSRSLRHDITLVPDTLTFEARVPRNATLQTLLRSHDLSDDLVSAVIESARSVFDPHHLRADNPYRLVRTIDGLLRRFEYHIDADRFLRIIETGVGRVFRPAAAVAQAVPASPFHVEVVSYQKERRLASARGTIDEQRPSLVAAMAAAGESVMLAMSLAQVFSGEIDFSSDLQRGDAFDVTFEKVYRDGAFVGYGAIEAAAFVNDGRRLQAFRFQVPGRSPDYYDEQGRSVKRFILKSPLRFEPVVTSGFSTRRLHPVLRIYRAHHGVDYRAPYGAPVIAVADGVVTAAGYSSGAGRMVSLRHSNGYESSYLHLSSIAGGVRPGARVGQGTLIGRVGASGLATGPHLDYRLKRNGRFVNPRTEHRRLPPGDPIPSEYLAAFHDVRTRALAQLVQRATESTRPADQ